MADMHINIGFSKWVGGLIVHLESFIIYDRFQILCISYYILGVQLDAHIYTFKNAHLYKSMRILPLRKRLVVTPTKSQQGGRPTSWMNTSSPFRTYEFYMIHAGIS